MLTKDFIMNTPQVMHQLQWLSTRLKEGGFHSI
jgi:hypothetical protein